MRVKVIPKEANPITGSTSYTAATTRALRKFLQAILLFLVVGKLWQFVRWDAPLFYHFAGSDWSLFLRTFACTTLGLTLIGIFLDKKPQLPAFLRNLLWSSTVILALNAYLSFVYKGYQLPQLIELSIQWSLPLFYLLFRRQNDYPSRNLIRWMKVAISLTFLGHGLYALGIPVLPGNFVNMTTSILGISPVQAEQFLFVAGGLDMLVCVGIWLPSLSRWSLLYAAFWGLTTALARVIAHVEIADMVGSLDRWLPEMLFRIPHGGLPLWLWWGVGRRK